MKMSGTSQKSKHLQVLCVAIELIHTMLIHIHKYPISIQHSMWKQTSMKFQARTFVFAVDSELHCSSFVNDSLWLR